VVVSGSGRYRARAANGIEGNEGKHHPLRLHRLLARHVTDWIVTTAIPPASWREVTGSEGGLVSFIGSDPLDHGRDALAHPDAHGAEGPPGLPQLQLTHRREHEAGGTTFKLIWPVGEPWRWTLGFEDTLPPPLALRL
jgi:hypothetical protein